jgi:hypothetical protein
MRDTNVYEIERALNKKVAALYKRTVFLDTRMRAFEVVLSRPWLALQFMLSPMKVMQRINVLHAALMKKHDEDMRAEMQAEAKRLTVVTANGELKRG